jgi:hypothetical protein
MIFYKLFSKSKYHLNHLGLTTHNFLNYLIYIFLLQKALSRFEQIIFSNEKFECSK